MTIYPAVLADYLLFESAGPTAGCTAVSLVGTGIAGPVSRSERSFSKASRFFHFIAQFIFFALPSITVHPSSVTRMPRFSISQNLTHREINRHGIKQRRTPAAHLHLVHIAAFCPYAVVFNYSFVIGLLQSSTFLYLSPSSATLLHVSNGVIVISHSAVKTVCDALINETTLYSFSGFDFSS